MLLNRNVLLDKSIDCGDNVTYGGRSLVSIWRLSTCQTQVPFILIGRRVRTKSLGLVVHTILKTEFAFLTSEALLLTMGPLF